MGANLDPFDLICHPAFGRKPLTRCGHSDNVKKRDVFGRYEGNAPAVLDALLMKYANEGVLNLDDANMLKNPPLNALGTPIELVRASGGELGFDRAVHDLRDAIDQETT
jgi:type I restriction enzyme R subunit